MTMTALLHLTIFEQLTCNQYWSDVCHRSKSQLYMHLSSFINILVAKHIFFSSYPRRKDSQDVFFSAQTTKSRTMAL